MWVLEQIRVSVDQRHFALPVEYSLRLADSMFGEKVGLHDKRKMASLCPNVITPHTIPEFCIPPKISPQQELKTLELGKLLPAAKAPEHVGAAETEAPAREASRGHIIQVENVDEVAYGSGVSDEESTNADPQSQAALSLPHLAKAQTCYGFCTILESPHTRRKESIFHNSPGRAYGLLLVAPRSRASPGTPHCASFSLNKLTAQLLSPRVRALHRQGILDSDAITSSTESSPFNSPLLARPPPKSSLLRALQGHDRLQLSRAVRKATLSRYDSLSTDEGSSTDNSPNVVRRASEGLVKPLPNRFSLAPPAVFPTDLVLYRDREMKESLVPVGREGTLRLSAEYCPENRRLRVRLISAEGLYSRAVDPKGINCNVSICLLPGKIQKQRSTVIKRSRNPIFNEDFFFDCISKEDIDKRSLRFKVINKMSTMKRDYVLGVCEILLICVLTV